MATKHITASGFTWNTQRERALHLTFEGGWTLAQIAEFCDVSPRTISDWQTKPEFSDRLEQLRQGLAEQLQSVTYAAKTARIIALDQMAKSARAEYMERPWLQEKRQIGVNRDVPKDDPDYGAPLYLINESYNRDAFESFRGALDDIAKEMGQRKAGDVNITNVQQQQVVFVVPEKTTDHVSHIVDGYIGVTPNESTE